MVWLPCSMYTNVKLPDDETWTKVSAAMTKEDLEASLHQEGVPTRG